ncbi:MAG: succinylglutamate desuccinylase/aspartoacylase family protein [Chloroflexota bacterium]
MQHSYRVIEVTNLANGQPLALPLHDVQGTTGGPTVGISAAIHGDEGIGVEVLRRLLEDPALANLKGRLLLLPLANPLAFQSYSRNTPIDMLNLNRVFPGDPNGWLTEQLAQVISDQFLRKIEVHLDLHAGGLFPVVDYVYLLNAPALSRAFGRPYLYKPAHPSAGTSTEVTLEAGVRTVVVELGGGLVPQEPYAVQAVAGLKNVLAELNMLPEHMLVLPKQTLLHRIDIVRPRQGGLFVPVVDQVGVQVHKGDVLGRVVSPMSLSVLEEMRCPLEQGVMILTHPTAHRIEPGDYGFMVGDLQTAEALP